jgi:hypothetical protein
VVPRAGDGAGSDDLHRRPIISKWPEEPDLFTHSMTGSVA